MRDLIFLSQGVTPSQVGRTESSRNRVSPTRGTLIKRRHTPMRCTNEIMYGRLVGPGATVLLVVVWDAVVRAQV